MKRWLLYATMGIAMLGLIGWRIFVKVSGDKALKQQASQRRGGAPSVTVVKAGPYDIIHAVQTVGTLQTPYRVDLTPKVTGQIEFLQVRPGDAVVPGQLIAKIDPSALKAASLQQLANVAQAKSKYAEALLGQGANSVNVQSQIAQQKAGVNSAAADLNQTQQNYSQTVAAANSAVVDSQAKVAAAQSQVDNAQASLNKEQANLANAKAKLDRTTSLYNQGFIAAQDLDDAKTAYAVQQQTVNVAEAQLSSARSSLSSAKAQLTASQAQAKIAATKGVSDIAASKAKYQQSQAQLQVAAANKSQTPAYAENLAALSSAVSAAQAQYEQSLVQLNDTALKSPIKGTVTDRSADQGTLASAGKSFVTIQFLDWLYVASSVPIEEIPNIRQGMTADVTLDVIPGKTFTGAITNVNPSADTQTRQFGILIKLPNADHLLKPGMFSKVRIVTSDTNADVAVPIEAVKTSRDGQKQVFVVDKTSTVKIVPVETGVTDGRMIEIKDGVDAGDQVITLAYGTIRDGQKVTLPGKGGGGGGRGGRRRGGGSGGDTGSAPDQGGSSATGGGGSSASSSATPSSDSNPGATPESTQPTPALQGNSSQSGRGGTTGSSAGTAAGSGQG